MSDEESGGATIHLYAQKTTLLDPREKQLRAQRERQDVLTKHRTFPRIPGLRHLNQFSWRRRKDLLFTPYCGSLLSKEGKGRERSGLNSIDNQMFVKPGEVNVNYDTCEKEKKRTFGYSPKSQSIDGNGTNARK
jgi:hypothetical protein